jgi:hypothetical protein
MDAPIYEFFMVRNFKENTFHASERPFLINIVSVYNSGKTTLIEDLCTGSFESHEPIKILMSTMWHNVVPYLLT